MGVVSMRGAPIALPSFATALFQRFLVVVVRSGACFPFVAVGSCTSSYFMGIRALTATLSSLP